MALKLWIDEGLCMRSMRCVYVAPKAFYTDDQGNPVANPATDQLCEEDLIALAQLCPNDAIVLERDGVRLVGRID